MLFPLILFVPVLAAQTGPGIQQPPLHSDLLDQLAGIWVVAGTVRDRPVHEVADAEWVLGHQFLRLHRRQLDGPVESVIHIGYDTVSERYVAIRLDSFSARGSETIGYGLRNGDQIQFTFEYPSGPLKETWNWDAKEKTWQFSTESKDRQGHWINFSNVTLHRGPALHRLPGRGGPPPQPLPQ
jgi:hypothetical protein